MPFDPSKPFEDLSKKQDATSGFDPNQPFDVVDHPSSSESFGRGVAQGGTLGFSDELAGAGGAIADRLQRSFMPNIESTHPEVQKQIEAVESKGTPSFGDVYRKGRDEERFLNEQAQKENPNTYLGGELVSGLAAPAIGGAKLGAAVGLGASDADLTEGDYSGAAKDVALGSALGKGAEFVGGKVLPSLGRGASWAGKKALTTFGPDMEAIDARLAGKARTDKGYSDLADEMASQFGELGKKTSNLSDEALDTLSNQKSIPRDVVLSPFREAAKNFKLNDTSVGPTSKHAESFLDSFGRDLKKMTQKLDPAQEHEILSELAEKGDALSSNELQSILNKIGSKQKTVSEQDLKAVIKKIDQEINWDDQSRAPLNNALKGVRSQIDDYLKMRNRGYESAMEPVSQRARVLDKIRSQFNLRNEPGKGMMPTDTTATKLQTSLRDNKAETQKLLEEFGDVTGQDFAEGANDIRLSKQFQNTGANGSRRTVLGATMGSALGHVLAPGVGTAVGGAIGSATGATLDKYGGQALAKIIDSYVAAGNSKAFGAFGPALEKASKKGPQALAVTAALLSQDPKFQEQLKSVMPSR